jgi:anti-sigma regulatory factor (Ser/Thr protein kinase)
MTSSVGQSVVVIVDEITKVGEARRRCAELTAGLGLDDTKRGKAALIVTEAATNLIKHAGCGQLIVAGIGDGQAGSYLEILALDTGRGMSDLSRCMADGYSSAGSSGTGLGAISRAADTFEIYSGADRGTVLAARLLIGPRGQSARDFEQGVVRVPAPGEQVCGDDWATIDRDGHRLVLMVDGLGHGPPAALAAEEAVRVFQGCRSSEPAEILDLTHRAIRGTRGAALAIARLDLVGGEVRYAGVGNISGVILDRKNGKTTSMVSQAGTVGHVIRKIQSFNYAWTEDSSLLMHSDGLATHWSFDRYPALVQRHPSLIAGVLYRDHKRGRDDATVLVMHPQREGQP